MVDADHYFLRYVEQIVEWWTLIITTCVTVALVLIIGNIPWTTIFFTYFNAVLWVMLFTGWRNREAPPGTDCIQETVARIIFFSYMAGLDASFFYGWQRLLGWGLAGLTMARGQSPPLADSDGASLACAILTFYIIILTRFFIGMHEEYRPDVIEQLLSQEKKKRQRERLGVR